MELRLKQTQLDVVRQELRNNGFITRNFCLKNYISRLGAIIDKLKHEGYNFRTENVGGDYKYIVMVTPDEVADLTLQERQAEAEERESDLFEGMYIY